MTVPGRGGTLRRRTRPGGRYAPCGLGICSLGRIEGLCTSLRQQLVEGQRPMYNNEERHGSSRIRVPCRDRTTASFALASTQGREMRVAKDAKRGGEMSTCRRYSEGYTQRGGGTSDRHRQ